MTEHQKYCDILVGVTAVGKSAWAQANYVNSEVILSTDLIIEDIAKTYEFTYDQCFSDLIVFAEKVMWNDAKFALDTGEHVVIDRTNLSITSRKKFIDFFKDHGYTFRAFVFNVPEDWQQRLDSRPGKTIPQPVLNNMVNSFRVPTVEEGFAEVIIVS